MPEKAENEGTAHIIREGKGSGLSASKFKQLKFYIMIIPLCFSLGSEKKSFQTLTINREEYTTECNIDHHSRPLPTWVEEQRRAEMPVWPPPHWCGHAEGEAWAYLLEEVRQVGPLICVTRGKLMVIAAGNHALVISSGLEAHIFGMRPEDFWELVRNDIDGPNQDGEKAARIWTFVIPERFRVPGSSSKDRTIKIFAAIVSEEWVYVLCDFSGLVRMHIKSRDVPWTKEELQPGTPEWDYLFDSFKGGPDWVVERPLAEKALDTWRECVLLERTNYRAKLEAIEASYQAKIQAHAKKVDSIQKQSRIDHHFTSTGSPAVELELLSAPEKPTQPRPPAMRPIVQEICYNSTGAFSGFGRHLANDFLYQVAIFPGTPSYVICQDDDAYSDFKCKIYDYLRQFSQLDFLQWVATISNQSNPFYFNELSNQEYMQKHIHIFRRTDAKVPISLWEKYCLLGLFDPAHTIGQPYAPEKARRMIEENESESYKWNRVYLHRGSLRAYTIIRAKCPPEWGIMPKAKAVGRDITSYMYKTTIGLVQFREQLLNRQIFDKSHAKRGRPSYIYTGRRGRPPKKITTKDQIDSHNARTRGRSTRRPDMHESEVDYNSDQDELEDIGPNVPPEEAEPEMDEAEVPGYAYDNPGDADADGDTNLHLEEPFCDFEDEEAGWNEACVEAENNTSMPLPARKLLIPEPEYLPLKLGSIGRLTADEKYQAFLAVQRRARKLVEKPPRKKYITYNLFDQRPQDAPRQRSLAWGELDYSRAQKLLKSLGKKVPLIDYTLWGPCMVRWKNDRLEEEYTDALRCASL